MQDARDQEIASLRDELSTLKTKLDLGRLLYEDATAEIDRLKEAIVSISRFVEKPVICRAIGETDSSLRERILSMFQRQAR